MKSLFFIAAAVAVSLSAGVVSAQESGRNKKEKDQEYRHIIVTLNSGEKVDGYIHRGWNVTAFDLRRENYSVKIVPSPDSKEAVKYTVDDMDNIVFVELTEGDPDGKLWEVCEKPAPAIGNTSRTIKTLMCVEKKGENSAVYWWNGRISVPAGPNGKTRIKVVTFYGIKFGDNDIVYPFMCGGKRDMGLLIALLKRGDEPELAETFRQYFIKGKEAKMHSKELKDDPTLVMRVYDEYLKSK